VPLLVILATVLELGYSSAYKRRILLQDRVECSGTQMADVALQAEKITEETGRTTRVVGWYHSHPHITVQPSHVDVNTQVHVSFVARDWPSDTFSHQLSCQEPFLHSLTNLLLACKSALDIANSL
jgi:JAB1/Mov34/MPN/PAD-1 ubiquitin protease